MCVCVCVCVYVCVYLGNLIHWTFQLYMLVNNNISPDKLNYYQGYPGASNRIYNRICRCQLKVQKQRRIVAHLTRREYRKLLYEKYAW